MSLRNIAIIAHVDHGKTTLIDVLLRQSGAFRDNQRVAERAMDSNDLERERGITILAKVTSLLWKDTRINIVDTPGHADFGGEVERILSMVDGAIVLVDAAEGPMPQTKFVLQKALRRGIRPIVAINKIDRPDERHVEVLNEIFDLFAALDATRGAARFPDPLWLGQAGLDGGDAGRLARILCAALRPGGQACTRAAGRIRLLPHARHDARGQSLSRPHPHGPHRLGRGEAQHAVRVLSRDGKIVEEGRISKVLAFRGLERQPIEEGLAGDIVAIAGLAVATVADTIASPDVSEPIQAQPIDPPTLSMTFRINDGPLAGQEGDKVQSRVIRERLLREAEGNVALKITENPDNDSFEVGRARRIAARHPHRDHAPGRLRADHRQAARRLPRGAERLAAGADRGSHHRRRFRAFRRGSAEAQRAARGSPRHAALGRRAHAPDLPRADARADRLPVRAALRHARHRRVSTACSTNTPPTRATSRAGGMASSSPTATAIRPTMPSGTWRIAARCSSIRVSRSTRA